MEPTTISTLARPARGELAEPMRSLRNAARNLNLAIDESPEVWSRVIPPGRAGEVSFAPAIVQDVMRRDVPMLGLRVITY